MLESWKLAPGARHRQHGRAEARRVHAAVGLAVGRHLPARPGCPTGVFNLVNGLGEEAGDALVKHPDVPLISFTGESRTGQLIFGNAAPFLKGLSMELGGKSPAVVFADADLEAAIDATVFGVFSLNGERCTAGSRILVERSIYDDFVERYAERAKRIVVGDPHDPKTEVGALVHPEHYDKVMCYVEIGKGEGRLVAGGGRPEGSTTGNYVAPTVFADVAPDARIFQEEIFGPVVAITPVRHRRGGARPRERREVRPRRLHLDERPQARAQLRAGGRGGHGVAQLATTCATCARRSAASRPPASATRAATARSTSTPTSRPCTSRSTRRTRPASARTEPRCRDCEHPLDAPVPRPTTPQQGR